MIALWLLIQSSFSFSGVVTAQNKTGRLQTREKTFRQRWLTAKSNRRRRRRVTSFSLKKTTDWLKTVKLSSWHDDGYLWEYTSLDFEGCTLKFKDRWLLPHRSHSWVLNTVPLGAMNETALFLERQSNDGIGLRINTRGEQIKREAADGSISLYIGTYYVNIGNEKMASKVAKALIHAIKLCKARVEKPAN